LENLTLALSAKTTYFFKNEDISKKWFLVDAKDQTLGRLASKVAHVLRGKHKPSFTPNADMGDFVIVINADKIKLTGKRPELKEYFHYTGYPGGATFETFKDLIQTNPEKVVTHAIKGMIPHNKLGRLVIKKLKVYAGADHPHSAQQPELMNI
jgi:large subunit ribosomal protein L13